MLRKFITVLRMIKFSHSLFALPFAMGVYLIYADMRRIEVLFLILIAMVSARSGAMAFNRLIDRHLDAKNPRTKDRELPRKALSVPFTAMFTAAATAIFLIAAALLNSLAFMLAPIALVILFGYSYTKRFTFLSHIVLGLALSLAPAGVMVGVTGGIDMRIMPLVCAVMCWVAGFDIIYSLADTAFDRKHHLHSIPADLGTTPAKIISVSLHAAFIAMCMLYGFIMHFGIAYAAAVTVCAISLICGYIRMACRAFRDDGFFFFTVNATVSVTFFTGMLAERIVSYLFRA